MSLIEDIPIEPDPSDGRKVRGDRTRRAILTAAVNVASVEGLEGLVDRPPRDRAGDEQERAVRALRLQGGAADLHRARRRGDLRPPRRRCRPRSSSSPASRGCTGCSTTGSTTWSTGSSPGGCFFAAATVEMDGRPGPVRDAVAPADDPLGRDARRLRPHRDRARRAAGRTPTPSSSRSSSTRSARRQLRLAAARGRARVRARPPRDPAPARGRRHRGRARRAGRVDAVAA